MVNRVKITVLTPEIITAERLPLTGFRPLREPGALQPLGPTCFIASLVFKLIKLQCGFFDSWRSILNPVAVRVLRGEA
jgi:hypothetical protein